MQKWTALSPPWMGATIIEGNRDCVTAICKIETNPFAFTCCNDIWLAPLFSPRLAHQQHVPSEDHGQIWWWTTAAPRRTGLTIMKSSTFIPQWPDVAGGVLLQWRAGLIFTEPPDQPSLTRGLCQVRIASCYGHHSHSIVQPLLSSTNRS